MHPAFFDLKRAHLGVIKFCGEIAEPRGLTPARVDMLRAILIEENKVRQSELWRRLGVSKVVVSIMVRALERLGFVQRWRCNDDKRTFWIRALKRGRVALRRIYYETITEGWVQMALISVFCKDSVPRKNWQRIVDRVRTALLSLRATFGRPYRERNVWDPDDEDVFFYYAGYVDNPVLHDIVVDEELDHVDSYGRLVLTTDVEDANYLLS